MSEIDDIFASKGKPKAISTAPVPSDKKKKKKKKNTKQPTSASGQEPKTESSKKRPAPETVVDPSVQIPQKRQKIHSAPVKSGKTKSKKEKEDEEDFKDSRGTGPRTCYPLVVSSFFSYTTQVVKRRKAGLSTKR